MKKKLIIGIVILVAIISIAVFCYVKFVSNKDDGKTSETVSKVSDDSFADRDLAEQLNKQLSLGISFTYTGFNRYTNGILSLFYDYDDSTHIAIKFKDNKVDGFDVISNYNGSADDEEKITNCIKRLSIDNNLFNFSNEESDEIVKFIFYEKGSKMINGISIAATYFNFHVIVSFKSYN